MLDREEVVDSLTDTHSQGLSVSGEVLVGHRCSDRTLFVRFLVSICALGIGGLISRMLISLISWLLRPDSSAVRATCFTDWGLHVFFQMQRAMSRKRQRCLAFLLSLARCSASTISASRAHQSLSTWLGRA